MREERDRKGGGVVPYDTARGQLVVRPVATGHLSCGGLAVMEVIEVYGYIESMGNKRDVVDMGNKVYMINMVDKVDKVNMVVIVDVVGEGAMINVINVWNVFMSGLCLGRGRAFNLSFLSIAVWLCVVGMSLSDLI